MTDEPVTTPETPKVGKVKRAWAWLQGVVSRHPGTSVIVAAALFVISHIFR